MAKLYHILLIAILFLTSCSQNQFWAREADVGTTAAKVYSYPWQTWDEGRTLAGQPLLSLFTEQGDKQFAHGRFDQALTNYRHALTAASGSDAIESLKLRVASTQLAMDNAQGALDGFSNYYKSRGLSVNFVRSESALMFAYIYGRLGNFNQSLAWSSQAIRSAKSFKHKEQANEGVTSLLKHLQNSELAELRSRWKYDRSLPELFARENSRRSLSGEKAYSYYNNPRYWESRNEVIAAPISDSASVVDSGRGTGIAIALPLTGRYSEFGAKVREGIELALSGKQAIHYKFFDTGGSASRAQEVCQHIVSTSRYKVILGPLLYSPSNAVAQCVRENGLKQFAFTKKADFRTGGGVYTLGVTVETQVRSLVKAIYKNLGLKKIAVVFPTGDSGASKFANQFRSELRRLNLEPAFEYTYYKNPLPDFNDLNKEIIRYNPQAIFILDDLKMATRISGAIGENSARGRRFLGSAEWSNEDLLQRSSGALRGAVFVSPYLSTGSEYNRQFNSSYLGVYGKEPDFLAAQGFDAAVIVENILKQISAGSGWQQAVNNFKEYQGLTGRIGFSAGGKLNRTLKVVEYIDGQFRELSRGAAPKFVYRGNNELKAERKN